jgi:hypothetical protein
MLQEKDNVLDSILAASGQFSNLNLICMLYRFIFNLTVDLQIDVAYMIRKKGIL